MYCSPAEGGGTIRKNSHFVSSATHIKIGSKKNISRAGRVLCFVSSAIRNESGRKRRRNKNKHEIKKSRDYHRGAGAVRRDIRGAEIIISRQEQQVVHEQDKADSGDSTVFRGADTVFHQAVTCRKINFLCRLFYSDPTF